MAVACLLVLIVVKMIQNVAADNVRQDRQVQDRKIYDAQVQTFNDAKTARTLCLSNVTASLNNRAMWEITVGLLNDAGLQAASAQLGAGPLLAAPPRSPENCPAEPVPPPIPSSIVDEVVPITVPTTDG